MGFTASNDTAGSDIRHAVEVEINQEVQNMRLPDLPGNDALQDKGDLWKIDFSDFGFSDTCITVEEIGRVSIVEAGNDGWIIDSITTFVIDSNGGSRVLTQDFDVSRLIDGDTTTDSDRRFDLTLT